MSLNRRRFLATVGLGAGIAVVPSRCFAANDAIRVGVIGLNGRGQLHMKMASSVPGFRLAAVCDVDPAVLGRAVERSRKDGHPVRAFQDLRELIASKEIDAVSIATPNHWHSLAAIWACQAGKDVYVEKPISHNVYEGRQLVHAARKYQRMVQCGTQARSNPDVIEAVAWVRAGNLGKPRCARGTCYKPRMSIGKVGKGQIPPGLDYDLWTGPALLKPLTRTSLHYNWHWLYDYGNGDLGNQGIHEMDMCRWFLGYTGLSPRVISIGGRLGYDDDAETPNTQLVYHAYDGPPVVFEVRGLPKSQADQADASRWSQNMDAIEGEGPGRGIGVLLACEGGRLLVIEGGRTAVAMDHAGKAIRDFATDRPFGRGWGKGDQFHWRGWLEAIQTRNPTKLSAESLDGHLSSGLCHMGMISHRIGRKTPASRIHNEISGNALLAERFEALARHLAQNGVGLDKTPATLGPWLAMDPQTERFVDNAAANALLTREYRKPFVVPIVE